MENRLYITNLSEVASLSSIRRCFSACGDVAEVQFAAERNAQQGPPAAYVTMMTAAAAEQALRRLNGTLLDGRLLVVTLMPERLTGADRREEKKAEARANAAIIAVTQQYRERHNMTYELDCPVGRLTLKVFFPPDPARPEWRIEARSNQSAELSVDKSATTRELALKEVAAAWQVLAADSGAPSFDWQAVARAMQAVRGV
ncbi:MAG TPA: RNA-binding protein [Polyangiaceae bacterium]|nr:RNA-binding protein [Polyangiaceae bacterium]